MTGSADTPSPAAANLLSAGEARRRKARVHLADRYVTKTGNDRKKPGSRRPNAERREESMTLILDHAEAEFAVKGYNGTTLASVAEVAGVDTALMRYYFGDKEKLFDAVFRRRGPLINAARFEALEEYRVRTGDKGTLEGVIEAFVRPGFDLAQRDDGHRNYAAIVAYVNSSKGAMHSLMSEVFDEVSRELIEHMERVMPEAPREVLYWGYHFLTGAFTFSLGQTGRIDRISGGEVLSSDFAGMADRLPAFVAGGIRALCALDAGSRQAG
jgi:AcrR family transcriptional regulator